MAHADSLVDLSNTAVESSSEGLTACFSRPMAAVGRTGMLLSASYPVAMNFAAAKSRSSGPLHKHAMDDGHLCSAMIQLQAMSQVRGKEASYPCVVVPASCSLPCAPPASCNRTM